MAKRVITGPEAANYEAEFSQSGAKAVIALAEKFIEKATAILDTTSEQFVVSLEFGVDRR